MTSRAISSDLRPRKQRWHLPQGVGNRLTLSVSGENETLPSEVRCANRGREQGMRAAKWTRGNTRPGGRGRGVPKHSHAIPQCRGSQRHA
ncbi:MAG: hypothetical protein [Microviridae sp.]|nr:MAG: hypothetical protein [Microviridae sp.]